MPPPSADPLADPGDALRLFRKVADLAPSVLYVYDLDRQRCAYANRATAEFLGLPPEDLPGQIDHSLAERMHPDDVPRFAAHLDRMRHAADDDIHPFEYRLRHADGSWRWMHSQDRVFQRDAGGRVRQLVGTASDVTERRRAGEAVRASQNLLEVVLDNIPQGVFWKDRQSRYLGCNQVVCRALGVSSPAELLGKSDAEFACIPAEQAEFFLRTDRAVMDGNTPQYGIIETLTTADGTAIWVETNKIPLRDAAGAVIGVLGTWQDVTARKRAEEALRESEQRYRSLVELAQAAILILEADCIRYCNPAAVALLGAPGTEALLGRPIDPFFHPDDRAAAAARRQQVRTTGRPIPPRHFRLVRLDQQQVDVESSATPCLFEGRPALQVVLRDVGERLRAEAALRGSEARLRLFVEHAPAAIALFDRDMRYLMVSRRWLSDFRLTGQNLIGRSHYDVFPDMPERWRAFHQRGLAGEPAQCDEDRFDRADGTTVWLRWELLPWHTDQGDVGGILIFCENITARKRAAEERRELEAQIQHAQKLESLGVLAGGIAHDFNNLLTSILGYASLARGRLPADAPAVPMLREVETGAQTAAELAQQMLAYSGRGKFVIRVFRLDGLVREMAKLLQTAVAKTATLHLDLAPAAVEGDATQVRQVVMNLITNASDALGGRPGTIAVRTGVRGVGRGELRSPYLPEELPAGEYAFMEVTDDGCGMSPETLRKIFDPFFTTKFTGRGLGLAAVLGIVRGHHGTLRVNSRPGAGSTFEVLLPAAREAADEAAAPPPTAAAAGQGVVLVVEDEESIRLLARLILEGAGYRVLEAADGREGVEVFERHQQEIRAVVLDLTMPRLDGMAVAERLHTLRADVLILVMSGFAEHETSQRFAGKGVAGFLQKPFRAADLLARVGQMLAAPPCTACTARVPPAPGPDEPGLSGRPAPV